MKTPITVIDATEKGLESLTYPYFLPEEQWMLDNVIKDLENGGIGYEIVKTDVGLEVWR